MGEEVNDEEVEVLKSIYCGDDNFKEIEKYHFQYKFGEDNSKKSLILQVKWCDGYPSVVPEIILDNFYNQNIPPIIKAQLHEALINEANNYLETPMTYCLFEWLKDHYEEFFEDVDIPEESIINDISKDVETIKNSEQQFKPKVKKENLTKAQKKKLYDRLDATGERPRGWNWVDIVRHLSQTGSKEQDTYVT